MFRKRWENDKHGNAHGKQRACCRAVLGVEKRSFGSIASRSFGIKSDMKKPRETREEDTQLERNESEHGASSAGSNTKCDIQYVNARKLSLREMYIRAPTVPISFRPLGHLAVGM